MEFIGDDGIPAKLLKDWVSSITKISKWISHYVEGIDLEIIDRTSDRTSDQTSDWTPDWMISNHG